MTLLPTFAQFILEMLGAEAVQVILFRKMVATILISRSEIYTTPELAQWSSNGGNSINKKIQQLLTRFGKLIPGAEQIVKEEVANLTSKKKSPAKEKNESPPKKRKRAVVKAEDGSDVDDW